MKKRKVLIIALVFLIIQLALLVIINYLYQKKDLASLLTNEQYNLTNTFQKGEKVEEMTINRTTYKYQKDNLFIYVYEYDDYTEVQKVIEDNIKLDQDLELNPDVVRKEKSILEKVCEAEFCSYSLAYDRYYLSASSNTEEEKEIEALLSKFS